MKKVVVVLSMIIILTGVVAYCFTFKGRTLEELETKYGKLIPHTPKATFHHFKTNYGIAIDCLYHSDLNKYTVISKYKIK